MPSPVFTLVGIDRVAGPAAALGERVPGIEVHLVDHDGGGDVVRFGDDEQPVDELGNRIGMRRWR